MEATAALLRATQIKKRLAGVTTLLELLQTQADETASETLAALLVDVLPCLKDHNFKVAVTSLEILSLLLPRVGESTLRGVFKTLWLSLVERLGDSKLQVREKAVDVVVVLTDLVGISAVFERLKPCVRHKNWRTREQTVHALWRCLEHHNQIRAMKNAVLDEIVMLLEDSAKEVRDAAMLGLEKMYEHIGASLMYDLESKNIRSGHMKMLTEKFGGVQPAVQEHQEIPVRYDPVQKVDAPLSSTARFLDAIKNKQYNFENVPTSNTAAMNNPSQSFEPTPPASPERSPSPEPVLAVEPVPVSGISDRDVQRELAKLQSGLKIDNDWSVRVESLKSLQRLAHRCSGHPNALTALAHGFRSVRELVCAQVGDLRSSVSREACQTLHTLAEVLQDEFNAHAEHCVASAMKATYVTIQVISTAADSSIRGMIESTESGYKNVINRLIDGAKTRNQVLRLNSVCYLTLTLEQWSVPFLSKHLDIFLQILPALLHDALAEVRAQARKCFWALHRLFSQEADELFDRLDTSTQKNLRDDPARHGGNGARPTTAPTVASIGRFAMRRDLSSRSLKESTATMTSDSSAVLRRASSSDNVYSSAVKAPASGVFGARRILGGSASQGNDGDSQRPLPSRVLSFGAKRVQGDDGAPPSAVKGVGGPLRVLKTVDPQSTRQDSNNTSLPSVPRAQRVQVTTESSGVDVNCSGPVPRKDRTNGLKRRAVVPTQSEPAGEEEATRAAKSANESSREQASTSRSSRAAAASPTAANENIDEALRRIENGLWSVRLEAVEVIDRALEQTRASSPQGRGLPDTRGDKKVDERVLIALIRHMADPHYRVAQAALKSLLSCLSVSSEHQVSPFLKTIMPRLFQKFIDPKESIRSLAREILEYLMSAYDASLLIGHVVQQLTDGSNMKLKAAVCHYLKSLLPGAREYIQQSPNNTNMRILLTKIAQLLEGDVPVAVSSAGSELLQVATSLFTSEVEASLPLLAPMKRTTLNKVLKARGIVLSLSNVGSSSTISSSMSVTKSTTEFAAADNNADQKSPTTANSRKRQAQSPLKVSGSPVISGRKESERLSPVVVTDVHRVGATPPSSATTPDNQLSYAKLSAMSDFATMLSSGSTKSAAEQFEELLAILGDNNTVEAERISAIHKMTSFIKSETAVFWDRYFPRVLSLLLEAAGDRDVNAIRLLQRLLRAQPQYAQEYLHPILLGLLDSVTGQVDLTAHLAELTLTDVVRAAASSSGWEATLELLIRLLPTHEPPVLQVLLLLLRTALDAIIGRKANDHLAKLQSSEWSTKLLAPLVSKLQHSSSDVRKRTVDVLVAYYFATGENDVLSSYLAEHVDGTRRRLVEIFIERKKADHDRSLMDCS